MAFKKPEYTKDGTRLETTNWRDEEISKRHREWGVNCPATDFDLLLLEFNFGKPVAICEYKKPGVGKVDTTFPNYRAVTLLADGYKEGPLPFFIAYYETPAWTFTVVPINSAAREFFGDHEVMPELEFVKRLYRMRNNTIATQIVANLNQ